MQFNVGGAPFVSSEFCKDQLYRNISEVRHPVVLHKKSTNQVVVMTVDLHNN